MNHRIVRMIIGTLVVGSLGCEVSPEDDVELAARAGGLGLGPNTTVVETTLANGDAADVFLPSIPPGARAAFEDELPVVVLLQGGLVPASQYSEYAETLARYGFVVIVPDHLRAIPPFFPSPVRLTEAAVVTAALDRLAELDADPTSPVHRVADLDDAALLGHSLGGAVALFAIGDLCVFPLCQPPFTLSSSVRAAALFGTNVTTNGVTTPIDSSGVSVALLQGDLDGVAVPAEAEATYEVLEPTRALIEFEGLNHFGITNDNVIPGTNADPLAQVADQDEGVERLARWTALWLRAELRGDQAAAQWVFELGGSPDGSVTVISD